MEPYREGYKMKSGPVRGRQSGITAIGFLLLAGLFGIVGFAAIRLVPMYIENFTLARVLDDVKGELDGDGSTPSGIRSALERHFDIESIELPRDDVKISQAGNGYQVRIQYENRAHYFGDIWLVLAFDKQVQIKR